MVIIFSGLYITCLYFKHGYIRLSNLFIICYVTRRYRYWRMGGNQGDNCLNKSSIVSVSKCCCFFINVGISKHEHTLIAKFVGPTWGLPGADRTQVGPMLATWTLLSGYTYQVTLDIPEAPLKVMVVMHGDVMTILTLCDENPLVPNIPHNIPHKVPGLWIFDDSLLLAWASCWINTRFLGDLRYHGTHMTSPMIYVSRYACSILHIMA